MKKACLSLGWLFLVAQSAWAVPEATLPASYPALILPLLSVRQSSGAFSGEAGVPIQYRMYRAMGASRGAIVIVSGRTESMAKYEELIFDLLREGVSTCSSGIIGGRGSQDGC